MAMTSVKGVNFRIAGTNAAGPAMQQFQNQLKGIRQQTVALQPLQHSWNKGLNENRRMVQQLGFQLGDFATQIAGGQSAMLAFVQQGGQVLQFFGAFGAVAAAALAVFGSIAIALVKGGVGMNQLIPLVGIFRQELSWVVDAVILMQDALIWSINLILNNLDVLATAGGILLMSLAWRWIASTNLVRAAVFMTMMNISTMGVVMGTWTSITMVLTSALSALRAVLMTVLPVALLIVVSWLIVKFIELVQLAGGFGNAMKLLGDLVVAIFKMIGSAGMAFVYTVMSGVYGLSGAFMEVFEWILSKWESLVNSMINGWNTVMDTFGLTGARGDPFKSDWLQSAGNTADSFANMSAAYWDAAVSSWNEGAKGVSDAWGAITDLFANKPQIDIRNWFGGAGAGKTPGGGGGKEPSEKVKEEADKIKKIFEDVSSTIDNALMTGFKEVIKGTKSLKDYAIDVLDTILSKTVELLMQPIFSRIAGSIASTIMGVAGLPTAGLGARAAMGAPVSAQRASAVMSTGSTDKEKVVRLVIEEGEGFASRVRAEAEGVAIQVTRQGLQQYDRNVLSRRVSQISEDPLVR